MGIGVVGPGGRLLWANDPFCGALGRTRAELLGAEHGGPITRMTPLAPSGELALAWVIELEDSAEPVSASEHIPAVYAFNWMGNLAAAWRRAADVEDHPLISDLVGRAVAGEPATGLLVVEGTGHEIDLMPAQDPQGRAGAIGVVHATARLGASGTVAVRLDRETAVAELARSALAQVRPRIWSGLLLCRRLQSRSRVSG